MTIKQLKEMIDKKPDNASVFVRMHSASCAISMNFPVLDVLAADELVFITVGNQRQERGGTA